MKRVLGQLLSASAIYGLGMAGARLISLFMMPIYTRAFGPVGFGQMEFVNVVARLLGAVIVAGSDSAVSFFFSKNDPTVGGSRNVVVNAVVYRSCWGITTTLVALIVLGLVNSDVFGPDHRFLWVLLGLLNMWAYLLLSLALQTYQLRLRPGSYVAVAIGHAALASVLVYFLAIRSDLGITGYFAGQAISSVILAIAVLLSIVRPSDFSSVSLPRIWRLAKFGLPLLPGGLAMYVMNTADRWVIRQFLGSEELGVYSAAARFALAFGMIVEIFRRAWWPVAMREIHTDNGPAVFRLLSRIYLAGTGLAIIVLTAISPWIMSVFTTPEFMHGYPVVGVLAWHSVFYGLYLVVSVGLWKTERTGLNAFLMAVAALINVALDLVLTRRFGIVGTALATSIAFAIWCAATLYFGERAWRIDFPVGRMTAQVTVGGATTIALLLIRAAEMRPIATIAVAVGGSIGLAVASFGLRDLRQLRTPVHRGASQSDKAST